MLSGLIQYLTLAPHLAPHLAPRQRWYNRHPPLLRVLRVLQPQQESEVAYRITLRQEEKHARLEA